MNSKKIGVLGGTFDPIHNGHLKVAHFCQDELNLEEVLFVPAGSPPHKHPVEEYTNRVEMVKLAIAANSSFCLAELEKPNPNKPQSYNYTFDTLNQINRLHKNAKIYFIIGEDNVPEIEKWHKYKELFGLAKFVVLSRNSRNIKKLNQLSYFNKLKFISMDEIDISSVEIRNKLYNNEEVQGLVPGKVIDYIKKYTLYKN